MAIGKLTEVDIRDLWKHEQYDFSGWLAQDDNIEYLNDILGITLTDIEKEKSVGTFRCDIVAKAANTDVDTDITVIIENQLEPSNHEHLGKIITYASGLNAKYIVWIVEQAREEHRSAIEWLNNVTDPDINFFLIEIHAYRIGNSEPAPKFEIIEEPNGFRKNTKTIGISSELTKTQTDYFEFWNEFNDFLDRNGKPFKPRKAGVRHYYEVSIGVSKATARIYITLDKKNKIGIELYISDNKELFDFLYEHKEEIEGQLTFDFDWQRLDNKKACRIKHWFGELNFDNHSNYDELMLETVEKVKAMKKVFIKYIKAAEQEV